MFRENDVTQQQSLLDSDQWMDSRTRKRLASSWAPVFYEQVYTQIDERPFSVLYSEEKNGRPNFSVRILLSLELIKHMQNISDADLLEKYDFDYLVNYAIGNKTLGSNPLAERTLYNFRERLYLYTSQNPEGEELLFTQFKTITGKIIRDANLSTSEQRIDTTQVMSNIKKSGRIALAYDVLIKGSKKVPESVKTETIEKVLSPAFKTEIIYKAKSSETESKLTILLRYCQEVLSLLEQHRPTEASAEIRILKRLLTEQAETGESGTITAKNGKQVSSKSLQSAYDEEATYRRKGEQGHTGYAAGITETCAEGNTFQVITDYTLEQNVASDVGILRDRMGHIAGTGCTALYCDGGFSAGDIVTEGSIQGINIQYTHMAGIASESDKLSVDDFAHDGIAVHACPGGHAPMEETENDNSLHACFDANVCQDCPLRPQCPVKPSKVKFSVCFKYDQMVLSASRNQMKENFKGNISKRAAIEGTNSSLKRKGMGKLRVRGKAKCVVVVGLKVLAHNIRQYVKFAQGYYASKKPSNILSLCPN